MPTHLKPYLTPEMSAKLARMRPVDRAVAMKTVAREEWERCAQDVLYWLDPAAHLVPYVYTKDPKPLYQCKLCSDGLAYHFDQRKMHLREVHTMGDVNTAKAIDPLFNQLDTIRPFTMLPYFEPVIDVWQTEKLLAVEKSRDMMMTWLITALYTWDTLFHKGKQNIFQSENATKTRELVERSKTLFENQPSWLRSVAPAVTSEGSSRAGLFRVPSLQSEIIGFPSGVSKIRMYHPSGVFSDEAAFNPEAEETFAAIKPAIDGGGRYTAISSASPGWFMRICRDLTHTSEATYL